MHLVVRLLGALDVLTRRRYLAISIVSYELSVTSTVTSSAHLLITAQHVLARNAHIVEAHETSVIGTVSKLWPKITYHNITRRAISERVIRKQQRATYRARFPEADGDCHHEFAP